MPLLTIFAFNIMILQAYISVVKQWEKMFLLCDGLLEFFDRKLHTYMRANSWCNGNNFLMTILMLWHVDFTQTSAVKVDYELNWKGDDDGGGGS